MINPEVGETGICPPAWSDKTTPSKDSSASPSESASNVMQYVTIATLGNALDFGDLTVARMTRSSGCASPTRGCALGGYTPGKSDVIDYIQISTLGNAVDFGNMIAAIAANGCCSNGHGGL